MVPVTCVSVCVFVCVFFFRGTFCVVLIKIQKAADNDWQLKFSTHMMVSNSTAVVKDR